MAINDTENPEEGTPRSKKDIRKERRQMKSIDKQRKAMGGEPLYGKEDYKAIKKPYQGGPGETSRAVDAEETKPDVGYVVYESGGYNPVSKERFEQEKKVGFGSGSQFTNYEDYLKDLESKSTNKTFNFKGDTVESQAINELAKGETTEKSAIIEALRKEANQRPDRTFTSSVEENKNINSIGNVVNEKINEANQEIVNTSEQVKQQQAQENLPGSGASVISKLDEIGPGITWDQTYKSEGLIPESREDIFNRAAASARKQAPQLAIEKLGVQDYYPDISRNIAVGTFTGSRIGSRTIYSGAGGLLPLGLYDARKRAIAAEIKRKEALMDELKSVPDIAKQFKPAWTNYVFDKWANYMEAYKNNPDGLANDMGFAKTNAQLKAIAENFKDVDVYMDDFKKKLMDSNGNAAAWATPRMLEIAKKFNSGYTPEKLEEFFSGKKNIASLKETVQAIPDGYKHIDTRMNDLLKDGNKVKRAITPKDGIEWTPQLQNKINDLSQQVSDGSIDYERYVSIMKEYFDIDFSPMINEWVDAHSLNALTPEERKAYKESLKIYAEAQMPVASFIPTFVTANNDAASRYATDVAARTAANRLGWEIEKYNREERKNPTSVLIDAAMVSPDGKFTQDYPGSKANKVPANKIYVDVIGPDGKVIKQWASALKNNVDKNGKVIVPYKSTLTGKVLTADDYANIPAEITYQATQGTVSRKSGNNYVYSNSGVGYTGVTGTDMNGNPVTNLKGLGLQFSMPEVPATQNGMKVDATVKFGNVFFGQTANVQSETIRSSDMTGGSVKVE